jgi:3-oxoacyl-[acyl-carrier protein] reductase
VGENLGVAFITGGNRGIGAATAQVLSDAGYQVVIGSRMGEVSSTTEIGSVRIDVSDAESIENAISEIESSFGPVEVLVANAGITRDSLLMRMTDDDIEETINTNLVGSIRLARRVLRPMIKAKYGRIIFMSSVVGLLGSAGQVNYSASKAGLVGAARSLTREVGSRGITINVVAPGFIDTDMTAALDESTKKSILGTIPAGRYGEPSEVAQVIKFLVSEDGAYISGAVIPVDGGLGMGH